MTFGRRNQIHTPHREKTKLLIESVVGSRAKITKLLVGSVVGSRTKKTKLLVGSVVGFRTKKTKLLVGSVVGFRTPNPDGNASGAPSGSPTGRSGVRASGHRLVLRRIRPHVCPRARLGAGQQKYMVADRDVSRCTGSHTALLTGSAICWPSNIHVRPVARLQFYLSPACPFMGIHGRM